MDANILFQEAEQRLGFLRDINRPDIGRFVIGHAGREVSK
jgi:hypothetical protein